MRLYAVPTADSGDLAALRDAARDGRAAAMSRRRALAAGRSALAPAHERVRTGFREAEQRGPAAGVGAAPPVAPKGQAAPSGAPRAPEGTAVVTDGVTVTHQSVADAHLGRALSVQRRRQLSQGKQALEGGADRAAAAAGAGAPTFIVHRGGAG